MQQIYHAAHSRGMADFEWLKSKHTFSFGHYYHPERMNFGVLRVLNDDFVAANQGFDTHPHRDMEIISIPLSGALAHRDSMGNGSVICDGEVQVMSAGTGITHSEMNHHADEAVQFLQIWVLPRQKNVAPRYQQKNILNEQKINDFQQIVSPNPDDEGVWIHQDAWFSLAKFRHHHQQNYVVKREGNGVYAFVIRGQAKIAGVQLGERDGLGLSEVAQFEVQAIGDADILLMDVPMSLPK